MTKFLLIISFSLICYLTKAQDVKSNSEKLNTLRTPQEQTSEQSEKTTDNINDDYLGHFDDYIRIFTSKQLPPDFPKFSNILTVDEYKKKVNAFLKLNSELLIEKARNKYSK